MLKGLYTAYTGMIHEQHRMDVMTNNLANANTNGFKKEGATSQAFDEVLAFKIKDTSQAGNLPKQLGNVSLGVKIGENYVDYSEGPIKETGNVLDLALSSNGFFTIEYTNKAGETSTKYTRDGNFTMTAEGYLVTQDGDFVLGRNNRPIRLNTAQDIHIDRMGNIYQDAGLAATIRITDFEDYDYLERYGENFFDAIEGATEIPADTEVYSGYLELANMSVVTEMVNMITIQRQYEANQKVITTYDSTLDDAVNQTGRV
ncbi:MAG: flagellar hook-basal body protein [Roseburia sp.]|nr:flagellar hook-basal body protein [Ruminococcus sp.]MCM1156688.1 flagellar hook-basal body protein [Roseburia sp.]MCM1243080.1 flagellar hook-basal body protein [Roseburia sp.]